DYYCYSGNDKNGFF
nr:immunoglobulin light chain junction region [Macaca mulatta]MOW15480.1 immunoglobulin light chain junction region [Macaca mulatta]MOW16255.1 immunoglobulin light chain junction region [Macaca mulatta]MOW16566.1 immunoglobulin light chain junction region [Macaca mulatta]MOW17252.1 immunoglobulin light chain junction region [Macaca mulatta]